MPDPLLGVELSKPLWDYKRNVGQHQNPGAKLSLGYRVGRIKNAPLQFVQDVPEIMFDIIEHDFSYIPECLKCVALDPPSVAVGLS